MNTQHFGDVTDAIGRIASIDPILRVLRRVTGLRVVLVARVTDSSWTACAVLDDAEFGLKPGDQLELSNTYWSVVGGAVAPLLINRASQDPRFAGHPGYTRLGIESYIAVPLNRRDGSRFGTLCALDPLPADLEKADLETFSLLAELIAFELEAEEERERREIEEEDRRSFIDAVAHDLKTPLQVIKSQAQLLQRRITQGRDIGQDVLEARLAQIEASVNRSTNLIDEMLDASRLRSGRPLELALMPVRLGSVVTEVIAQYRDMARHHSIRVEHGEDAVDGIWDPSRLARVIGNLVSNAIRYSPQEGEITIGVHHDESHAVLTIADEGIGIPAADLPYIFEPHRRGGNVEGRLRGTGIGLAGSKQIIEQHGGTISVKSVEGRGSVFTVRLPLAQWIARDIAATWARTVILDMTHFDQSDRVSAPNHGWQRGAAESNDASPQAGA